MSSTNSPLVQPFPDLPREPSTGSDVLNWTRDLGRAIQKSHAALAARANDSIQQGTFSQLPPALGSRRFFYATDTGGLYYDSGSWVLVAGSGGITTVTLVNGLNSNITLPAGTTDYVRIIGPTLAFSVGGIAAAGMRTGKPVLFRNTTAQQCTIVNQDASSTAANQIYTMTGANVVQAGGNGSNFALANEPNIPGMVLASHQP